MRILCPIVLPSPTLVPAFNPTSRTAALYDCKSSVTNRSGTKAYFFWSLRISFSAACLFRLDWTSTSRTSPSASTARNGKHSAVELQIDLVEMPTRVSLQATLSQVGPITGPKWFTQRRTVS
jgi:hypothetical protein